MADVTIDGTVNTNTARVMRSVVYTTSNIGYQFYIDASTAGFGYSKTTDGGATWGAFQVMSPAAAVIAADVWFDQWTPGDTGTLIHTWHFEASADDVVWRTLDTNGDTLGTARVVFAGLTAVAGRGTFVSGTKTRSGYLYCAYDIDAGAERGLHQSTDGGTTWSANLSTTFVEATLDEAMLFPAESAQDPNDCWAVYHDTSANAITLKRWDVSDGSATESSTISTFLENTTDLTGQFGFSGAIRHSDGHLILAVCNERDTATADHEVWNITSTSTFAALTNITTNIDDHYYPAVFIDQQTDDLYVAYNGKRDGSEVMGTTTKSYYTKSTDDGATWSAGDTAVMEGAAAALVQVWAPLMGPRFIVTVRVAGVIATNKVNSVAFLTQAVTMPTIASTAQLFSPALAFDAVVHAPPPTIVMQAVHRAASW